jgi:hypothetical protein
MFVYVCIYIVRAYVDIIAIRGRGGDRKDRGRADDEDAVMEMDIDPSTGNYNILAIIYNIILARCYVVVRYTRCMSSFITVFSRY